MINPGFREVDSSPVEESKGLKQQWMDYFQTRMNFQDRRNIRFLLMALLVFLVIFAVLELKQCFHSATGAGQSAPEAAKNNK